MDKVAQKKLDKTKLFHPTFYFIILFYTPNGIPNINQPIKITDHTNKNAIE